LVDVPAALGQASVYDAFAQAQPHAMPASTQVLNISVSMPKSAMDE
jgi:hypothetical protein